MMSKIIFLIINYTEDLSLSSHVHYYDEQSNYFDDNMMLWEFLISKNMNIKKASKLLWWFFSSYMKS